MKNIDYLYSFIKSESHNTTILQNEPMKKHTTFNIGGPADIMCIVNNEEELITIISACRSHQIPIFLLGSVHPGL